MAAAALASSVSASRPVVARKTFTGVPVGRAASRVVCRVNRRVVSSAEKKEQKVELPALPVGITAGVAALMANPLVAEAAVTPSLKNLLNSVVAGGLVLAAIAAAITGIANFDPLSRGRR